MRVHVAFTPAESLQAGVGIVVDVLRGHVDDRAGARGRYARVLCCAEIEEARALRASTPDSLVGGERDAVRIEGFDVSASLRELVERRAETLILSTTNGTRAILTAAATCETVLLGSLLNLDAVARAARVAGGDVSVLCAGYKGTFALDDALCAGRIVERLGGEPTDAALAATLVSRAYTDAHEGLLARTYGPPGLEEAIAWCAREDVLDVVPRLARMLGTAAEITL